MHHGLSLASPPTWWCGDVTGSINSAATAALHTLPEALAARSGAVGDLLTSIERNADTISSIKVPRFFGGKAKAEVAAASSAITRDALRGADLVADMPHEAFMRDRLSSLAAVARDVTKDDQTFSRVLTHRAHLYTDELRMTLPGSGASRAMVTNDIERIVMKEARDVTEQDMRTLAALTNLPDELRPVGMPPRGGTGVNSIDDLIFQRLTPANDASAADSFRKLRMHIERARIFEDTAVTRDSLTSELLGIVSKPRSEQTMDDVRRVSLIAGLPDSHRPALVTDLANESLYLSQMFSSGVDPLNQGNSRMMMTSLAVAAERDRVAADPATTRAAVSAELRSLIERDPATLSDADMWRMAVLTELPESLRPLGMMRGGGGQSSITNSVAIGQRPYSNNKTSHALDVIRLTLNGPDAAARAAAQHPNLTARASVTAVLSDILRKPDHEITSAEIQDLAALSSLPADARPAGMQHLTHLSLEGLRDTARATHADPAGTGGVVTSVAATNVVLTKPKALETLRLSLERSALIDAGAISRETVLARMREILNQPIGHINTDHMRELDMLSGLPDELRPVSVPLGGTVDSFSLASARAGGVTPTDSTIARKSVTALRDQVNDEWLLHTADGNAEVAARSASGRIVGHKVLYPWLLGTETGAADLTSRIASGAPLDNRMLTYLVEHGSAQLERLGYGADKMFAVSMRELRGVGHLDKQQAKSQVLLAAQLAEQLPEPSGAIERELTSQVQTLMQRNVDRVTGKLTDGYPGYPNYTELGEAAAAADMLTMARDQRLAAAVPTASSDVITW